MKLAPFNPTHADGVVVALEMLKLNVNDVLIDIGCGDGRLVIEAARIHGLRAVGIEYDESLCDRANLGIIEAGVVDRVSILHLDATVADISDATAIFIYLVPEGIKAMLPKLLEALANGTRIVSYVFSLPNVTPKDVVIFKSSTKFYLYEGIASVAMSTVTEGTI